MTKRDWYVISGLVLFLEVEVTAISLWMGHNDFWSVFMPMQIVIFLLAVICILTAWGSHPKGR
jgi:uncharacterized membrane protein YhhN